MKMEDSQRIEAPRETVWAALNDADVLKACIPGCEELVKHSDTEMEAKVLLKVGPVKAKFGGKVTLEDLIPPESYRIVGEGSGGVAGFAKGGAVVRLEEDGPDATILHYDVDAQIGGKIAQLGSRLIDSTSKRLAGEFFKTFGETVAPSQSEDEADEDQAEGKKGWLSGMFGKKDTAAEEDA
ncbi:SRPBCC family protein [Roseibium polysiphoniae]|uniref:Carbon monoxide dehydrogenase subunit G n=1 Tax=Roseibium polysiphoniae TaxID=2571221 RepID=A0ABR9C748_9HYPH|nr:carbon monoxide dehydrogenase subunit G [Roseibium polysiphoniae]MBD8874747.1 carbon monoxide dehydrogenase subunit G [Roseibium polysiphoniae]